MKRLATLALILGISFFTIGCAEKKAEKPADKPAAEADADQDAPGDAMPDAGAAEENKE